MIPSLTTSLPEETAAVLKAELQPGERIIWVGQPIPSRIGRGTFAIFLFGIPWTAFAIFWIGAAAVIGWKTEDGGTGSRFFTLFFPLFGLPFVLVGIGMLSFPFLGSSMCQANRLCDNRPPCTYRRRSWLA